MGLFKNLFKKKEKQETTITEVEQVIPVESIVPEKKERSIASLVEISISNDIPILVGSQSRIEFLKEINPEVKTVGFAKGYTLHVREGEFPNGVIVDKSISEEMVEHLKTEFSHIKIVE